LAGSKKWFVYTTDNGNDFAIELDESNTEAVNAETQDYVDGLGIIFALPRNITPRRLFYEDNNGNRVISCVALTQAIYNGALSGVRTIDNPLGGGSLTLIRSRPEKIRLPYPQDTGLTDGDNT